MEDLYVRDNSFDPSLNKDILVIQNFTNFKHNKSLYETEIMIWTAGLLQYKAFGYKLKLYCTPDAIPFLEEWHLKDLYDEIDDSFLDSDPLLKQVDETRFWSTRKLRAIHHELVDLKTPTVIYSDTDIIMKKPFGDLSKVDALFWSPEPWSEEEGNIYVDWEILSTPDGYEMPSYIKDTGDAINCGIMYFRDPALFKQYTEQYFAFVLYNPCTFTPHPDPDKTYNFDRLTELNNVWACNAEQRILNAVLSHASVAPHFVMGAKEDGRCPNGEHYFIYRMCWKALGTYILSPRGWVDVLNETIFLVLSILSQDRPDLYDFWVSRDWLKHKDFIHNYDSILHIFPVKKYR